MKLQTITRIITTLAVTCLGLALFGAPSAEAKRSVSKKTVRDTTFANGLTVLAMEDKSDPLIAFWVQYDAGSRNDPAGKSGMAKVAQEIFDDGSLGYRKGEYSRLIHSSGGSSFSAASDDGAYFGSRFPKELLREVALIEADRMEYPSVTAEKLASAKNATLTARRSYLETDPYAPLVMEMFRSMYMTHPYGKTIWGLEADINSLAVDEVEDWMYQRYRPSNAIVSIVGDFDTDELFELLIEIFADIPSEETTALEYPSELKQIAERRTQIQSKMQIPVFIAGFHIPETTHPDIAPLRVLSKLMIGEKSSRVYRKLVTETNQCLFASGSLTNFTDPGLIYFYAFMNQGQELGRAEETLFQEMASAASEGVDESELVIAKNQLESEFYLSAAPALERAGLIAMSYDLWNDGMRWVENQKDIQQVTTEDVQRVAAKYLTPENRTVIEMLPQDSSNSANNDNTEAQ